MKTHATAEATRSWSGVGGWVLAFLSFPPAGLVGLNLAGASDDPLAALLAGASAGAVIGAGQWLALRRWLGVGPVWIALSALGLGVGQAAAVALLGSDTGDPALPLRGLLSGALLGLAQAWLLRGMLGRAALAWPLVVMVGWVIGWMVTRAAGVDLTPNWPVFGATGALTFQLLSGAALRWLAAAK